jgi:DNA-binding PadR family transcriptional regulator
MGFLRPCLLFLLARDDAHGYSLLDELDEFGIDPEQIDPSLIYRALRDMEDAGWVASEWGEESQGPQRRVYRIVPEGKSYLADLMNGLRRQRDEMDHLLQAYEKEVQQE